MKNRVGERTGTAKQQEAEQGREIRANKREQKGNNKYGERSSTGRKQQDGEWGFHFPECPCGYCIVDLTRKLIFIMNACFISVFPNNSLHLIFLFLKYL